MKKYFLLPIIALFITIPLSAQASTWAIDPVHTTVGFKVQHLTISNVKGIFETVSGTLNINDEDITKSTMDIRIDTNSINTHVKMRDDDLRSPNFFDVKKYPEMTFVSKNISKTGENSFKVEGYLKLHGIIKPVTLNVKNLSREIKDPWGGIRRGVTATAKINRTDFGIGATEPASLIGDEISITLDVEIVKQP
ncbi:MAG: YceI family protein [Desulfuromonadales bacterium]|nr:YceI family protein [Desulfuromonadales bacterium]